MYVCQTERQRLRFSFLHCYTLFIFHFCVLYVHMLERFISHLLHVCPWDIGKIFPQRMQSDSWENDYIQLVRSTLPVLWQSWWQHADRNLKRIKSEVRSIQACSHDRHDHVWNNQHCSVQFFLLGLAVTPAEERAWNLQHILHTEKTGYLSLPPIWAFPDLPPLGQRLG